MKYWNKRYDGIKAENPCFGIEQNNYHMCILMHLYFNINNSPENIHLLTKHSNRTVTAAVWIVG